MENFYHHLSSPLWYASYIIVLLGLAGYGYHRLVIVFLYLKHARKQPVPKQLYTELPMVTVQLPVFNEMYVVDRLLDAVAAIDYPQDKLQIQILDDSTDETVQICRDGAERLRARGFDVDHIHRTDRTGYKAGALENGTQFAKGEFLFILDADNLILPLGIPKLVAALDGDPEKAFAYGIIEKFDVTGAIGIESFLDWDPERLRYGNYVDAMALIRRTALEAVGGYSEAPALGGWEDYALWAAMAEQGLDGVRIPDFIGRYRVSQYSMLSVIGIDHSTAWTTLLRNYPQTMRA